MWTKTNSNVINCRLPWQLGGTDQSTDNGTGLHEQHIHTAQNCLTWFLLLKSFCAIAKPLFHFLSSQNASHSPSVKAINCWYFVWNLAVCREDYCHDSVHNIMWHQIPANSAWPLVFLSLSPPADLPMCKPKGTSMRLEEYRSDSHTEQPKAHKIFQHNKP